MPANRSSGNSESNSMTTTGAITRLLDSVKGFKYFFQFCVGDTTAIVAHRDFDLAIDYI